MIDFPIDELMDEDICYQYTGTVFEKARQSASKIVPILRGFAKGESTARRELKLDRENLLNLRHRVQDNFFVNLPGGRQESADGFEADELFQDAGEKGLKHDEHDEHGDPPRRRARGTATTPRTARPSSRS